MPTTHGPINSGVAAGGAGVATANASTPIQLRGFVEAIYIQYNDTPPSGTTDVVIATVGLNPKVPAITLLTITNGATNANYILRHALADEAGSATTAPADGRVYIDDYVNVNINQANDNDSIDVWITTSAY